METSSKDIPILNIALNDSSGQNTINNNSKLKNFMQNNL